jgi:hypothetical protein
MTQEDNDESSGDDVIAIEVLRFDDHEEREYYYIYPPEHQDVDSDSEMEEYEQNALGVLMSCMVGGEK